MNNYILKIKIENIGKIGKAEFFPGNGLNEVVGRNNTGKTTFIESIIATLSKKGTTDRPLAVKRGEKAGEVTVWLTDESGHLGIAADEAIASEKWKYQIIQSVNADGDTKKEVIVNGQGSLKSPQAAIDRFLGEIAINPLALLRKTGKEQKEALLTLNPLVVDRDKLSKISGVQITPMTTLEGLDLFVGINKLIMDKRKEKNTEADRLKAVADSIQIPQEVEVVEQVSLTNLIAKRNALDEIEKNNQAQRQEMSRLQALEIENRQLRKTKIFDCEKFTQEANRQIAELKKQIANIETNIMVMADNTAAICLEIDKKYQELGEEMTRQFEIVAQLLPIDYTNIDQQISQADEINKKAAESARLKQARDMAIEQKAKAEVDHAKAEDIAKGYTEKLKAIQEYQVELLKNYEFPYPGLGFRDDGLIYNGNPLEQEGMAKNFAVCLAIAAKRNPTAGFILSTEEVQIDRQNRDIIHRIATENGYQVLIARVAEEADPGRISFVIEEEGD